KRAGLALGHRSKSLTLQRLEKAGPIVSACDGLLIALRPIGPEDEYLHQLRLGELVDVFIGTLLEIECVPPSGSARVRAACPVEGVLSRRQQQETLAGADTVARRSVRF